MSDIGKRLSDILNLFSKCIGVIADFFTSSNVVYYFRYVHSKNRAGLPFSLALNSLSDRTMSELATMRGRRRGKTPNGGRPFPAESFEGVKVPESLDWRLYGTDFFTNFVNFLRLAARLTLAFLLRCCDTSEGSSHMRFLLEFCHHWSSRGRTFPKGEKN